MNELLTAPRLPARPAAAAAARRVLVFAVGGQRYAVPLADVREVVPMAALAESPALPAVVAGFLNLGGTAVAVVPVARLFGQPEPPPGRYTPLLVLRHADPPTALRVDRVERIADLPAGAVVPARDGYSFNAAVDGMATLDGGVVLVLAADRLLLDKEQQWLADLHDREQARLRAWEGTPS